MPILDISGSDDRRNLSRPESESDFEEIHPGQSVSQSVFIIQWGVQKHLNCGTSSLHYRILLSFFSYYVKTETFQNSK